jgi:hypothetical protein
MKHFEAVALHAIGLDLYVTDEHAVGPDLTKVPSTESGWVRQATALSENL